MKSIYLLLIACFLCLSSCNFKTPNKEDKRLERILLINFDFYPSGCHDCPEYSINVSGNSLTVIYHHRLITRTINLSHKQYECLDLLLNNIQQQHPKTMYIDDSWGVTLRIDNVVVYKTDDFGYESCPKDIRALIAYLVYLSPTDIELRGFA